MGLRMSIKSDIIDGAIKDSVNPRQRGLLLAVSTIMVAFFVLAVVASWVAYSAIRDSANEGAGLAEEVQSACEDPGRNTEELGALCDSADQVIENAPSVVEPSPPLQGKTGEDGEPGPAPTEAEVALAVDSYCATNNCRGTNATPTQVATAVALYCDAAGRCRGPVGAAGSEGQDGTDGDDGDAGPPPSSTQISDAVATYCSTRNECRGATGPEGPVGPAGVVNVESNCDAPEGQVIDQVNSTYSSGSQTITINCTYKDDSTIVDPPTGG